MTIEWIPPVSSMAFHEAVAALKESIFLSMCLPSPRENKMHPTEEGLLLEICERPDDDFPREVLADFLEDNGRTGRAEFIRWSLKHPNFAGEDWSSWHWGRRYRGDWVVEPYVVPVLWYAIFRRGFVAEVRCPCAEWLKWGETLVRRLPITRVEFLDKRPRQVSVAILWTVIAWYFSRDADAEHALHALPVEFSESAPNKEWVVFSSVEWAVDWASNAAVDWARKKAGLPQLIRGPQ